MIVFTDNIDFAGTLFEVKLSWVKGLPKGMSPGLQLLVNELFPGKQIFYSKSDKPAGWSHFFIAEHSKSSQFEILKRIINNNNDIPDLSLCLAGSGDNFKGYRDRSWISMPGNLHLCALMKPGQRIEQFHVGFTTLAAVSVVQTLDRIPGLKEVTHIKWVNDILLEKKKVAGVLTQTQTQGNDVVAAMIGIGLNVNKTPILPADLFVKQATSINDYCVNKPDCSLSKVVNQLTADILKNYNILLKGNFVHLLNIYRKRSIVIGKNVMIYSDPLDGPPHKTNEGRVNKIGENLELYLDDKQDPVIRGKIVF